MGETWHTLLYFTRLQFSTNAYGPTDYSRARRILDAARTVVQDPARRGLLPQTAKELEDEIPGVGRYTAGAISAIAFGNADCMVDGNVLRVLSRQLGIFGDVKSDKAVIGLLWAAAQALVEAAAFEQSDVDEETGKALPSDVPGRWGQALMELGSTLCTPQPNVSDPQTCPLRFLARASYSVAPTPLIPRPLRAGSKMRGGQELLANVNIITVYSLPDQLHLPGLRGREDHSRHERPCSGRASRCTWAGGHGRCLRNLFRLGYRNLRGYHRCSRRDGGGRAPQWPSQSPGQEIRAACGTPITTAKRSRRARVCTFAGGGPSCHFSRQKVPGQVFEKDCPRRRDCCLRCEAYQRWLLFDPEAPRKG